MGNIYVFSTARVCFVQHNVEHVNMEMYVLPIIYFEQFFQCVFHALRPEDLRRGTRQKQWVTCIFDCFLAYVGVIFRVDFTWNAPWQFLVSIPAQQHVLTLEALLYLKLAKAILKIHLTVVIQ